MSEVWQGVSGEEPLPQDDRKGTEKVQGKKKGRHRKKALYAQILKQMEFYFGDSNLTKDRFLSQLIQKDPYVDLSVFLAFNRIRKLLASVEDLRRALTHSELLEISEDGLHVRRRVPLVPKTNVDVCTVYVERLKPDATHDWLSSLFAEFGEVVYVSIPKYRHRNGAPIKGFAFVEFADENGAQAALAYFDEIGRTIPSATEPDRLCSIVTFEEPKQEDMNDENKGGEKKRKRDDDEEEDNSKENVDEITKKTKLETLNEETLVETHEEVMNVDTARIKKKKKDKKALKRRAVLKESGMQVLSKIEWKRMRNRYLNAQRNSMRELKQHLRRQRFDQPKEEPTPKQNKTAGTYELGLIVKIDLHAPCEDNRQLRTTLQAFAPEDIKYVDIPIPVASTEVYVRFGTAQAAREFCEHATYEGGTRYVLKDDAEKGYWERVETSRLAKRQKDDRKEHRRGRDKLLRRAEKAAARHIRFGEDDEVEETTGEFSAAE